MNTKNKKQSYSDVRRQVQREINMWRLVPVDRAEFKKSAEEKEKLKRLKSEVKPLSSFNSDLVKKVEKLMGKYNG